MKYLLGDKIYHLFDLSEEGQVRFVYDTSTRRIEHAEVGFEGVYYTLSDEQISDLEAGSLATSQMKNLEPSDVLPEWALPYVVDVEHRDDDLKETFYLKISDIQAHLNALDQGDVSMGVDPALVKSLIAHILDCERRLECCELSVKASFNPAHA